MLAWMLMPCVVQRIQRLVCENNRWIPAAGFCTGERSEWLIVPAHLTRIWDASLVARYYIDGMKLLLRLRPVSALCAIVAATAAYGHAALPVLT